MSKAGQLATSSAASAFFATATWAPAPSMSARATSTAATSAGGTAIPRSCDRRRAWSAPAARSRPRRADGKQLTVGYEFTDTGESFTLVLRNSVLEITPSLTDGTVAVVQLTRAFGNRILRGDETLQSGMDSGAITVRGNPADVQALHAVFDRPDELPTPNISLH